MADSNAKRAGPSKPTHEVRAGPGDAGAEDAPRELPKSDQYKQRSRWATPFTMTVIAVGILVVVIGWFVT